MLFIVLVLCIYFNLVSGFNRFTNHPNKLPLGANRDFKTLKIDMFKGKHDENTKFSYDNIFSDNYLSENGSKISKGNPLVFAPAIMLAMIPDISNAADPLSSGFVAYGHFTGLVGVIASLTVERIIIKPNLTKSEEKLLGNADIAYGIFALLLTVSGILRATQYEKGWDYYSHEPIFWLKMVLFSVVGGISLFPTTKIIQRAVTIYNADNGKGDPLPPMSTKLANRIKKIVNAELLAMFSIPLTASLMARGVGYMESFPWQLGAGAVTLTFGGLGFTYLVEALTWTEEDDDE